MGWLTLLIATQQCIFGGALCVGVGGGQEGRINIARNRALPSMSLGGTRFSLSRRSTNAWNAFFNAFVSCPWVWLEGEMYAFYISKVLPKQNRKGCSGHRAP